MRLATYGAIFLAFLLLVVLVPLYLIPRLRDFYRAEIKDKHNGFHRYASRLIPGFVKAPFTGVPDLPKLDGRLKGIYHIGLWVTVVSYFVIGICIWLVFSGMQPVLGFVILPFALTAWFYCQIAVPLGSVRGYRFEERR